MTSFIGPQLSIFHDHETDHCSDSSSSSSSSSPSSSPSTSALHIYDGLHDNHDRHSLENCDTLPSIQHAYFRPATHDINTSLKTRNTLIGRLPDLCITLPFDSSTRRSHPFSSATYHALNEPIREQEELEEEDMATESMEVIAIGTAPNSPPELSYSKSSKSSSPSLRSSSIDDADNDSANDSPHFEELSLDEAENAQVEHVQQDNNLKPERRPTLRRPQPRSAPSPLDTEFRATLRGLAPQLVSNGFRDGKMSAASGVLQDQSTNLPTGRMHRGFMSYSAPKTAQHEHGPQRRPSSMPRSPDPGSVPSSPLSTASITPRASQDARLSRPAITGGLVKRSSWLSSRKTIAELEAEYNDDDDGDVPYGAILENVPISPLPGQHRLSRTPSPLRPPPRSPSYSNLHSANVPKNARRPLAPPTRTSPRSPPARRPPMLQHGKTVGAFPPRQEWTRKQKSKSWDDDLNEEVRQLSVALEEYAERAVDKRQPSSTDIAASNTNMPRRQSDSTPRAKTGVMDLPPLQKGNIMIDPLPISKEKEAVLTRTRPSWLPPKSQKEEKKHLQEWQRMMARAAEMERQRESSEKEAAKRREETQVTVESVWEHDILLNWGTAKAEAKKKELCWDGIAPSSRGAVWKKAAGNDLELSSTSYHAALNRASRLEEKLGSMSAEDLTKSKEHAWFTAIERDVPTAFPILSRFAPGSPGKQALSDVLKAYAIYRSDIGYVYGTHLVAALLCLNLEPDEAFIVLANLLNRPIPLGFLVHDQASMKRTYSSVLNALELKHKKLHAHLVSSGLDLAPEEYLDPLFRCLFAYNLNATLVSRLWDVYILNDDQVLIDAAVAVLGLLEPKLYGTKQEVIGLIGWENHYSWQVGGTSGLMTAIRQASTDTS